MLVVQTDAGDYARSLASVIDATSATVESLAPVPVPEPAMLALVGFGALALLMARKRN